MTTDNLENLSVNALVDRFAAIGVEQYKASDAEEDERYKELLNCTTFKKTKATPRR